MYTSTNKGRQMLRNQSGGKKFKKRNSKNLKKNQKVKKTRTVKEKIKLKTMKQVDLDIDSKSLVGGKLGTSYMDGERQANNRESCHEVSHPRTSYDESAHGKRKPAATRVIIKARPLRSASCLLLHPPSLRCSSPTAPR